MTPAQQRAIRAIEHPGLYAVVTYLHKWQVTHNHVGYTAFGKSITRAGLLAAVQAQAVREDGRPVRPTDAKHGLIRYLQIFGYPTSEPTSIERFLGYYTRTGISVTLLDFHLALVERCRQHGWPLRKWFDRTTAAALRRHGYKLVKTRIGVVIYDIELIDHPDVVTARRFARSQLEHTEI